MKPISLIGLFAALVLLSPAGANDQHGEGGLPDNPVQIENRKAGTKDWLLARTAIDENMRSRAIEGYVSALSARAGDAVTVFVSTEPPAKYRCEVFRMGYYGGAGARSVKKIGPLEGVRQPEPARGARELRHCRWSPSFTLTIGKDWLSGVYLGKLSVDGAGPESYVVFVVRDDRKADLLFQVSDFTWQAYNRWPDWASLYDYQGNKWETTKSNDIGFDRPYGRYYNGLPADHGKVTKVIGSGEFLLWEFPLAFWLEREGHDVSYISNLDTHRDAEGLKRAKGFLSVGHDEYWTRRMLDNVSAARDAGLSLAFLSGNSISGEIILKPGPAGVADRVFARNRHFPDEAELMGASSYGVGLTDWTCTASDHWIFEGTGMKAGEGISDLVGWEYHGPPLKQGTAVQVVARGRVKDSGAKELNKEYAALVYEGAKGNLVFNAATCWWSMPLSSPPGYIDPRGKDFRAEDRRVHQITRNVIDRILRAAE